jgi:hypothetical protein
LTALLYKSRRASSAAIKARHHACYQRLDLLCDPARGLGVSDPTWS